MIDAELVCRSRVELIRRSLTRHRLVFLQLGAVFDPVRDSILGEIGEATTVASRDDWLTGAGPNALVVTGLETCATDTGNILGEVRELTFAVLDSERQVLLVSRAPRIAFHSVPGSSILEDAALVTLPLLDISELGHMPPEYPPSGWKWPAVAMGRPLSLDTYGPVLRELGQGLIAALDHALFEVNPKGVDGLEFLSPRELEGLRGSGIVEVDESGVPTLSEPGSLKQLREAVAAHISATVEPAGSLGAVTSGLWFVERRIRNEVRSAAINTFNDQWRSSCLGGLSAEVLRRAQLDASVAAKSVSDLRDPLEWLTLGELMDLVRSQKFDNLGVEPAIWRKLQEQLVPIRNRIAHVRMFKPGDDETVTMWASLIKARFGT